MSKNKYTSKLESLIKKLNRELEIEKEEVAAGGADAIFAYASDYVQKCDMISTFEEILDLCDEDCDPLIPEENIDYLLNGAETAFSRIDKYFGFYMDDDTWLQFRMDLVWSVERAFQDAGYSHDRE